MRISVPGDKSISQRALILSVLAEGESEVRGLLRGGDPASTAGALRALGALIPSIGEWVKPVRIRGLGLRGLKEPATTLDLGNSGTGARLLLGVLAGQEMITSVTGDASLRNRPMRRVTDPLGRMGAGFEYFERDGFLPLRVRGGSLEDFQYRLPVASAQVKSALLLAGLVGGVRLELQEPGRSRDHTENMLMGLGVNLRLGGDQQAWTVALEDPPEAIPALMMEVPGDFSSAAFFLVLGLLTPGGGPLVLDGVGLNPTRSGLLQVLARMGARVVQENVRGRDQGEPLGDLLVEPGELRGTEVVGEEIPGMIDEVPILAVAAARAQGITVVSGAGELRVKETDRIRALVENLRAVGVEAEEREDGLEIQGTDAPLKGEVESFGDHRIAMAFGVLGALPGNQIRIRGEDVSDVSFPGFWHQLEQARNR